MLQQDQSQLDNWLLKQLPKQVYLGMHQQLASRPADTWLMLVQMIVATGLHSVSCSWVRKGYWSVCKHGFIAGCSCGGTAQLHGFHLLCNIV
jgi:hypothetical protein